MSRGPSLRTERKLTLRGQIEALHAALKANPSLRLTLLLDYLRSTRETPKASSASLAASLQAAFPDQVDVRLYHTPELTGWKKRWIPRRFDEGWGLQHMKCYGFDDDVMMSGYVPSQLLRGFQLMRECTERISAETTSRIDKIGTSSFSPTLHWPTTLPTSFAPSRPTPSASPRPTRRLSTLPSPFPGPTRTPLPPLSPLRPSFPTSKPQHMTLWHP